MSARSFLDTNVLVYTDDTDSPDKQHRLSFWDALIVRAALVSGCARLYSEDLQHGWRVEGLEVVNPFR
jgi:predicted nucleic acid-binding protein